MKLGDFFEDLRREAAIGKGEESRDRTYSSQHPYGDEATALEAFKRSQDKLFNVNAWSNLPGLTSTFTVYDASGQPKLTADLRIGDYVKIELPGPVPENWVRVTAIQSSARSAEFTVQPSESPGADEAESQTTAHFFSQDSSSTFQVELQGTTLMAYEIGKNERINNGGTEAGDRSLINTLVAETGWAFFQEMQWTKLTDYLVHL